MAASAREILDNHWRGVLGKGSDALADDSRRRSMTEGERGCGREGRNCDGGNCRNDMSIGTC
jgi:hypothetical protein